MIRDFTSRKQTLINSGVDDRITGIKAVLEYKTVEGNITEGEAETALSTLQSFLWSFFKDAKKYRKEIGLDKE